MTPQAALVVILAVGLLSSVRSKVERTGPARPARAKNCEIELLEGEPADRPREVLGRIHVWVTRNKITREKAARVEEAQSEFRKQGCKLGADAVIMGRQTVSHTGEFKLLYVKADAVRFTGK